MAAKLKIVTSKLARWRVSTQGTLAREHVSTQGTLAREHVSTQDTLTREHVFSTQGTQFSRLYRNTWNLLKIAIILIISKSGQGKTYVEYEASKNSGYGLVARVGWL